MSNLAGFKRIVSATALAGLLAGSLLTVVQQVQVAPIILQAEVYEEAATPVAVSAAAASPAAAAPSGHEHTHDHGEWEPENGWERALFTALANISLAVGFGLFLGAAFYQSGAAINWRSGLLWGAAGYAVFFIAPSLGLPPELPGTTAAPLADRQLWWTLTVAATATGLSLLVFARSWKMKLLGAVLLAVPHFVGAPQPLAHATAAPADLVHAFVYATAIANAVFWLALGGLMGFFYRKNA
jgi:cobalt transporter subunit CbtA